MNYTPLFLLSLFVMLSATHCTNSAPSDGKDHTEQFADLGKDTSFQQEHEEPAIIDAITSGEPAKYPTADGKMATATIWKAKNPSNKYLFVIHEWWGLNDFIRREAARLHNQLTDVNVLALDLYDGGVATTREAASELMQAVETERAEAIINGAIALAGKEAEIATIGWCFGGGWSLKSSILAAEQGAGCVIYYGMPVQEEEKLSPLKAPVLGIFAEKDEWITPQVANDFKKMAGDVGKEVTVHIFDADHAFANPSSPRYVEQAAQEANALALEFLKERLN